MAVGFTEYRQTTISQHDLKYYLTCKFNTDSLKYQDLHLNIKDCTSKEVQTLPGVQVFSGGLLLPGNI